MTECGSLDDAPGRRQLHMVWPKERLDAPPPAPSLPQGYALRQYRPADVEAYCLLMERAGFEDWDAQRVGGLREQVLAEGFFLVEHKAGGMAATAVAVDKPTNVHPRGGELGCLAAAPAHRGRGLGAAVCAAVTRRFIEAGYREIYLKTDDWRLAAIALYLKLGYVPLFYAEGMQRRWAAVRGELGL